MILASSANEVVSEMQLPPTATHKVEWAGAIERVRSSSVHPSCKEFYAWLRSNFHRQRLQLNIPNRYPSFVISVFACPSLFI